MRSVCAVLLALLATSAAQAQQVAFRSEAWLVTRALDPMTDAPECTGRPVKALGGRFELSRDALNVSYAERGGLRGLRVRYGEERALDLRLPTDEEAASGILTFAGADLRHLLRVHRLRIEVMTLENVVIEEDIDLRGFEAARRFIRDSPRCNPT